MNIRRLMVVHSEEKFMAGDDVCRTVVLEPAGGGNSTFIRMEINVEVPVEVGERYWIEFTPAT